MGRDRRIQLEAIRSAVEKVVRHYAEDSDAGRERDSAATAVRDGALRFRVSGPHGEIVTDAAESLGGGASAPTPGWYLRAALAACDASVIAIEAARDGILLSRLEVSVTSETDFRGTLVGDAVSRAIPLTTEVVVGD